MFSMTRWFAKRFLHPDIVAEYDYIFLWDEDLGVEQFHPDKYVEYPSNFWKSQKYSLVHLDFN